MDVKFNGSKKNLRDEMCMSEDVWKWGVKPHLKEAHIISLCL